MKEKQPELSRLEKFHHLLHQLSKTGLSSISAILSFKEISPEEGKKRHLEEVIPFELKKYLDYSGKKGVRIDSLGQQIIVRASGQENDRSLVANWEQLVNWAKQISSEYIGRSTKREREQAFLILTTNKTIRDNEKRILEHEKSN